MAKEGADTHAGAISDLLCSGHQLFLINQRQHRFNNGDLTALTALTTAVEGWGNFQSHRSA